MPAYRVYDDFEALSRAAGELFAEIAGEAIAERGRFVVALSGGNTPQRMFELLALPPLRDAVDWARLEVFWGDERCVPADDSRNNARSARKRLLDRVPIPPDQIHPIECTFSPARAAVDYEDRIRRVFSTGAPRFDLIFLGLGKDGHTASIFPGSEIVHDAQRWVREVETAASEPDRVSFTPFLINQAAVAAFLVSGGEKSGVVREVRRCPEAPLRLPAQRIAPLDGRLIWMLDRAAAGDLDDP
ncbi:MAG: 6-phosphogluconolactonase [Desulfosarcinaceae bacterium]